MGLLEARHEALDREARQALGLIAAELDEDHEPLRVLRRLAGLGLLRACVPAAYGGLRERVELRDLVVLRMAIAERSPLADTMFAMQGLGSYPVTLAGADAQKAAYLPGAAAGSHVCAFAITEPDAGSDIGAMKTRAEMMRSEAYALTGEKCFISNAGIATHYVLFAHATQDRGPVAFLVAGDTSGLRVEPMKVLGDHPLGRLQMNDMAVPMHALIGKEGMGTKLALSTLDFFRTSVGAAAVGMAQRALDEAKQRVKSRVQFGKAIAEHQATQLAIAEMAVDVQAARLLCLDAACAIDEHLATGASPIKLPRHLGQKAAMAKLFATEAAQRVIDRAVQLWGGAGLVEGATVERLYREVRALRIYEGTSEIQKLVIARAELTP